MRHDIDHVDRALAAYDAFRGAPSRLAVVADDEGAFVVPLRFRQNPGGSTDAASSEVRSAPIFTEGTSGEWRHEAICELLNFLQLRGVASLFLRFHPLLDSSPIQFARLGAVVKHGPTYDIPLNRPLGQIRADMRRNHQRGSRKFRAEGFVCKPDTDWHHLPEFHELYSLTMDRVAARPEYRFTLAFFEQLRDALGDKIALWVTEVDGRLAMGHIVTECDGIAQALYAGIHPAYQKQVPQIGLYDSELQWAHEQGCRDYFFDGGDHESLRHFKEGITKVQPNAASARIIVDPVEYGRLCAQWELDTERVVGRADGYFPPYLQPAGQAMSEPAHV